MNETFEIQNGVEEQETVTTPVEKPKFTRKPMTIVLPKPYKELCLREKADKNSKIIMTMLPTERLILVAPEDSFPNHYQVMLKNKKTGFVAKEFVTFK